MRYYIKIINAIKEGSFFRKCRDKRKEKLHLHYVRNKNVEALFYQSKTYETLFREYKNIIDKEIPICQSPQISNKIWICWLQGYDKAPELVKACINSVRINNPHKDVIILDDRNIANYIEIPEYIEKKRKSKIIPLAHYSDIVRISILCKYGGIWMDSTVLCTGTEFIRKIDKLPLFVFKQLDLIRKDETPIVASSWFISAESRQRILMLTRELLLAYWKRENYLKEYYLFHLFFAMAAKRYPKDFKNIPTYNNHTPHVLQFEFGEKYSEERWKELCESSDIHKLNNHLPYEKQDTYYAYVLKQYTPTTEENYELEKLDPQN